jgi:hypothetical protein
VAMYYISLVNLDICLIFFYFFFKKLTIEFIKPTRTFKSCKFNYWFSKWNNRRIKKIIFHSKLYQLLSSNIFWVDRTECLYVTTAIQERLVLLSETIFNCFNHLYHFLDMPNFTCKRHDCSFNCCLL